MRAHARVGVIGGGIFGASIAYHLAKLGWNDCVLLDKAELTSGITWHAAGQVSQADGNFVNNRLRKYACELYRSLEAETGESVTWHNPGSLRLSYSQDHLDWMRSIMSSGKALGIEVDIVDPAACARLHPFLDTKGVIGGLHTPNDGYLDPSGACHAMAAGARQMGVEVVRFNRVTGLQQRQSGEWLVQTEKGDIVCEHVVNAAGTHARQIAAWVGYDLPLVSCLFQYLITDAVPEFASLDKEFPVLRGDEFFRGYMRLEQKSALIGVHESSDALIVWEDGTPWESQNELFEPDLERAMPWLQNTLDSIPVLADVGIKRVVHGAAPVGPDGVMIVGPAPGLRNFWCCGGGNATGVSVAPGLAKHLAEWIVGGAPELDMRAFDPRRFGKGVDRDTQIAKAREYPLRRHQLAYPGKLSSVGRDRRMSGVHERLAAAGADFEPVQGWERPRWFAAPGDGEPVLSFRRASWFANVARECATASSSVVLIDQSASARFSLGGRDAGAVLSRMIAGALPAADGAVVSALMATEAGTLELDASITRLTPDRFLIGTAAAAEMRLVDWIEKHRRPGEDAVLENLSDSTGVLLLAGPRADAVLAQAAGRSAERLLELAPRQMIEIDIAGIRVSLTRNAGTGEPGWNLQAPMAELGALYDTLWQAGQNHGIAYAGSYALRSLTLEMGAKGPAEMNHALTLAQSGLLTQVDLGKGDFTGRAALAEQALQAAERRIALLSLDEGDSDCAAGEAVYRNGRLVGAVTSGGYGHRTRTSLAFALIDADAATPGTKLEVLVLGTMRAAKVITAPLYGTNNTGI
jgi:dimethylglycine dehydrogenase